MPGLAVPLLRSQIEAARQLHARLVQWEATDAALRLLAERLPGNSIEEVLPKVAAINQLYGTNVYAVVKMAQHVAQVLATKPAINADLVEEIANFNKRRHLSFASKFCHFFCLGGEDLFPIYDSYARRSLEYHLGRPAAAAYDRYVKDFDLVRECAKLTCSLRDLDRYLWLGGLYRAWRKNPAARINVEVSRLFSAGLSDLQPILRQLCPELE